MGEPAHIDQIEIAPANRPEQTAKVKSDILDLVRVNYLGKLLTAEEVGARIITNRINQAQITNTEGTSQPFGEFIKEQLTTVQDKITKKFHTPDESESEIKKTLDLLEATNPIQPDDTYTDSDIHHALLMQLTKTTQRKEQRYAGEESLAKENEIVAKETEDQDKINIAKQATEDAHNAHIVSLNLAKTTKKRLQDTEEERKIKRIPPVTDLNPENMHYLQAPNAEFTILYEIEGLEDTVAANLLVENYQAKNEEEQLIIDFVQIANTPSLLTDSTKRTHLAELIHHVSRNLQSKLPTEEDNKNLLHQSTGNFRQTGDGIYYTRGGSDDIGIEVSPERELVSKLENIAKQVAD